MPSGKKSKQSSRTDKNKKSRSAVRRAKPRADLPGSKTPIARASTVTTDLFELYIGEGLEIRMLDPKARAATTGRASADTKFLVRPVRQEGVAEGELLIEARVDYEKYRIFVLPTKRSIYPDRFQG